MNCLLIAATAMEIAPFLEHFRNSEKKHYIEFNLHIMITGVGLMATTYHLTKYLATQKPDFLIQLGIAGSYDTTLAPGKVVVVKNEVIADIGVQEANRWNDLFDLKLLTSGSFPYTGKKLTNPHKELLKRSRLPGVNAVSVNQISTRKNQIAMIKEKYNAKIESMEGAALHYVALQENIPFVQIRGISNYAGERNKKKWELQKAIENSNATLIRLFESL